MKKSNKLEAEKHLTPDDKPFTPPQEANGEQQPPVFTLPAATDDDGEIDDPFDDLDRLRVSQDFAAQVGVKKIITAVPCRKPNRHEFARVHGDENWRLETAVFEDQVSRQTYLVDRELHGALVAELRPVCLFTAITRQGDLFLWPVKLPCDDGRTNAWNESALAAARLAESRWLRVAANLDAGCYDIFQAVGTIAEPDWPDITFRDLVRLCFRDRFVRDFDHPVLRVAGGGVAAMDLRQMFSGVWVVDFEFHASPGERPRPICMVAREFFTTETVRLWSDELATMSSPPFATGRDTLLVAYFASAEMGCFLAEGWPFPQHLLDLYLEFRRQTNGLDTLAGNSLVGALLHHGIPAIDVSEKDAMRDLAIRGGPFSTNEKRQLLDYCQSDVVSTCELLAAMLPELDLPRALLRGRYMRAVASMEWAGVPVDRETLDRLRFHWDGLKETLIHRVDADFGVYEGTTFKQDRFNDFIARVGIPWPRLASGGLALDDNTFRQMAKCHPVVAPLRELRHMLGDLRLENLSVGTDDRNRCLLSPFSARTSRNQPSNAKFVFGPSCWIRGLIKPPPGRALAYVDWCQQEFAIAAALSGDCAMRQAFLSADPYLTFAKQAGAVPESATKNSHPQQREQFKVCALGVQYGMKSRSLAQALGQPEVHARELLQLHRQTYPAYWRWSQAAVDHAMLFGYLDTVFGWRIHVGGRVNPRGLANFPMQANGAEMLRIACCLATEHGISVCAPVHDALLVEGDADSIDDVVLATQQCMLEAGRQVLDGFELRTDAEIVCWPDRYIDKRGKKMWNVTMSVLDELESDSADQPQALTRG